MSPPERIYSSTICSDLAIPDFLSALLDRTGTVALVTNVEGEILAASMGAEQQMALERSNLLGQQFTGPTLASETNPGDWRSTAIVDESGQATGTLWVKLPVKSASFDQSHYQSAEFYLDVIDTNPTALFVKDREGRYVFVNKAVVEVFGKPAVELLGRNDHELAHCPPEAQAIRDLDLRVMNSRTEIHTQIEQLTDVTGRVRYWESWKRPLIDKKGRCDHMLGVAVDRTRQIEAERELRRYQEELENRVRARTAELESTNFRLANEIAERMQAEKEARRRQDELAHATRLSMIGELAAEIAHEVGQPLTIVMNFAQGCRSRLENGNWQVSELERALDAVITQASMATQIIRRLRSFLKKAEPVQQPLQVGPLLLQSIRSVEHESNRMGIHVDLDCSPDIPDAFADEIQIQQVVMNLLLNAFDACSTVSVDRRRVSVFARLVEPRTVEVSIEDRGVGLPPEKSARPFEPFFTTKPNGLGLGLSICRGIIVAHGGSIALLPLSQGTRVTFTLPVAGIPENSARGGQ